MLCITSDVCDTHCAHTSEVVSGIKRYQKTIVIKSSSLVEQSVCDITSLAPTHLILILGVHYSKHLVKNLHKTVTNHVISYHSLSHSQYMYVCMCVCVVCVCVEHSKKE